MLIVRDRHRGARSRLAAGLALRHLRRTAHAAHMTAARRFMGCASCFNNNTRKEGRACPEQKSQHDQDRSGTTHGKNYKSAPPFCK